MKPAVVRAGLAALLAGAFCACTGRLEHDPSAFFGGIQVIDGGAAGAGGAAAPAAEWDAAADAQGGGADAGSAAGDGATPAPSDLAPMADAAPASACAPGMDGLALIGARCGGCHNSSSAAKGLDLRSPGLALRVVGVPSTCQGRVYLTNGPGGPIGHLLAKLDGPVAGCGNLMPVGGPALTEQEKACVREWAAQAIAKVGSGR